ncbi:hypothetical protein A2U01_0066256, partial [Trifolium medium]|nr:hypothetical protein [Trifolium medium]
LNSELSSAHSNFGFNNNLTPHGIPVIGSDRIHRADDGGAEKPHGVKRRRKRHGA